jgi:hypothetical protein
MINLAPGVTAGPGFGCPAWRGAARAAQCPALPARPMEFLLRWREQHRRVRLRSAPGRGAAGAKPGKA